MLASGENIRAGTVSRSASRQCRRDQHGFTLLEMLAVLAILAVILGSVAPSLSRAVSSVDFATKIDRISRAIPALRTKALLERRRFVFPANIDGVDPYKDLETPMPDGWSIEGRSIVFMETGVCLGGTLRIVSPDGRSRELTFTPPDCKLLNNAKNSPQSENLTR